LGGYGFFVRKITLKGWVGFEMKEDNPYI